MAKARGPNKDPALIEPGGCFRGSAPMSSRQGACHNYQLRHAPCSGGYRDQILPRLPWFQGMAGLLFGSVTDDRRAARHKPISVFATSSCFSRARR